LRPNAPLAELLAAFWDQVMPTLSGREP